MSLKDSKSPNGFSRVFKGPKGLRMPKRGPNKSLRVHKGPYGYSWVFKIPKGLQDFTRVLFTGPKGLQESPRILRVHMLFQGSLNEPLEQTQVKNTHFFNAADVKVGSTIIWHHPKRRSVHVL